MGAGDKHRAFRVCALIARRFAGTGLSESMTLEQSDDWANRSFEVAEPETREEALARFYLAVRLRSSDPVQAWPHLKRAHELGMQLEDDEVLSRTFAWVLQGVLTPAHDYVEVLNSNEPFAGREFKDLLNVSSAPGLVGLGEFYLQMGDRAKAETQLDQLKESAKVTRQPEFDAFAVQFEAQLLTVDGKFDEIFTRAAEYEGREKEANRSARSPIGRMTRRALMYMGRDEEALSTLRPPGDLLFSGGVFESQRAIILPRLGRSEEALAILNRFLALPEVADPNGSAAVVLLRYLLEAGCANEHLQTCRAVFKRMELFASMVMTEGVLSSIPRSLAEACRLFGNPMEARRYYEQAVEVCARISFRPEIALARLGLAEILLDHHPEERDSAIEHLDFAIAELRDMKMQPALERALGRRGLLKA
jgi:tetratricopeptide (TPR) repeat protein